MIRCEDVHNVAIAQHRAQRAFFTTDARGTGLGLYIARELADVNGARLEYIGERDAGKRGACFRLTMKGE